ncbi:MAG: hypothetical protein EZS28_036742, partial [Streblomastix strix]
NSSELENPDQAGQGIRSSHSPYRFDWNTFIQSMRSISSREMMVLLCDKGMVLIQVMSILQMELIASQTISTSE